MRLLKALFVLLLLSTIATAQQKQDTIQRERVYLVTADSGETYEEYGVAYRRVIGSPARFLHNGTYILCDTALLNTKTNILDAVGNVQILQDGAKLLGDKLHYIVDQNLAEVRGRVVELIDKDNNRLRTNYLDFNTKDSIGHFFDGGSMVDKDGNTMESESGFFESKRHLFRFYNNVEMSTDTVQVKCDSLYYHTDTNIADLFEHVNAWHTNGFIKSNKGTYNRNEEQFHFTGKVYMQTENQEAWAEQAKYNRNTEESELLENIQIVDTTKQMIIFGNRAYYKKNPQFIELTDNPVLLKYQIDEETNLPDTLFFKADTIIAKQGQVKDLDSIEIAVAKKRWTNPDAKELKQKNEEEERRKEDMLLFEEQRKSDSLFKAENLKRIMARENPGIESKEDRLARQQKEKELKASKKREKNREQLTLTNYTIKDFLLEHPQVRDTRDSLFVVQLQMEIDKEMNAYTDSLSNVYAAQGDSIFLNSTIQRVYARHNVKAWKTNLQVVADSILFNTIDSLARLFGKPALWNENTQFTADSIRFRLEDDQLKYGEFYSNAFIISQEDSTYFHQVKSKDMYVWFRDNDVYKYRALGQFSAIFYLREDSLLTTANIKSGAEMTVFLKNRTAEKIIYKDNLQSDIYPLFELSQEKSKLKDFEWRDSERPHSRMDITDKSVRKMSIGERLRIHKPEFELTQRYFPGQINKFSQERKMGISTNAQEEMRIRDSLNKVENYRVGITDKSGKPLFYNKDGEAVMIDEDGKAYIVNSKELEQKTQKDSVEQETIKNTIEQETIKDTVEKKIKQEPEHKTEHETETGPETETEIEIVKDTIENQKKEIIEAVVEKPVKKLVSAKDTINQVIKIVDTDNSQLSRKEQKKAEKFQRKMLRKQKKEQKKLARVRKREERKNKNQQK